MIDMLTVYDVASNICFLIKEKQFQLFNEQTKQGKQLQLKARN